MKRRTLDDWRQLIELQQQSNLTIVDFCKQNKLTLSSFYKFRQRLFGKRSEPTFIKADVAATRFSRAKISSHSENDGLKLTQGNTQILLPLSTEPEWLASLLKALNP